MAYVQEKLKAESQRAGKKELDKSALDKKVLEELGKGDEEREEKITLLYQKFDGTTSRLEKMKQKEEKAKLDRWSKHLDPQKAEEQRLFELFEKELDAWREYEEVG